MRWLALTALLLVAPTLWASETAVKERSPEEVERLYQEIGDQLFCICGCRDKLLECSHNVCGPKDDERKFLRELCKDPELDSSAIKQGMVKRFGEKVLIVPQDSPIYWVLILVGLGVVGSFSAGFWVVTRHSNRDNETSDDDDAPTPTDENTDFDQRIADDLKDLE